MLGLWLIHVSKRGPRLVGCHVWDPTVNPKITKPGLCSSLFCTRWDLFSIYQSLTVMMPLKYSGMSSSSITASKSLKLTRMGSKGHLQGSPRRTNSSGHPSAKCSSNMPQTSSYWLQHIAGPPWWRHQMETFSALLAICTGITGGFRRKGQWRGALMFSLIYVWTERWVNNRASGDLRRHRTHYDVTVVSVTESGGRLTTRSHETSKLRPRDMDLKLSDLKFYRHLDRRSTEAPVKCQSDLIIQFKLNSLASWYHLILRYDFISLTEQKFRLLSQLVKACFEWMRAIETQSIIGVLYLFIYTNTLFSPRTQSGWPLKAWLCYGPGVSRKVI